MSLPNMGNCLMCAMPYLESEIDEMAASEGERDKLNPTPESRKCVFGDWVALLSGKKRPRRWDRTGNSLPTSPNNKERQV